MTVEEARLLLERNREDFGGKDPGNAMVSLRRVYSEARPADRVVLNCVIREWLESDDVADRFDALFLTSEFQIVQNLDLVSRIIPGVTDPASVAAHERKKYDRIATELQAWKPDFGEADAVLSSWAKRHGLHVLTRYRDDEVRSIPIVGPDGRELQIWLENEFGGYSAHASPVERRRPMDNSWSSEPVNGKDLEPILDALLDCIDEWSSPAD
jgi:hypothetical protein